MNIGNIKAKHILKVVLLALVVMCFFYTEPALAQNWQEYDEIELNKEYTHNLTGQGDGHGFLGDGAAYIFTLPQKTSVKIDLDCLGFNDYLQYELISYDEYDPTWYDQEVHYFCSGVQCEYHETLTLDKGKYVLRVLNPEGNFLGNVEYTLKISVKKTEKITLSEEKINLKVGKTKTLKYEITPKDSFSHGGVTWTTSNKKIATVSSKGKINAVGFGTATITATLGDGTSAECKVVVKEADIYVFKGDKKRIPNINGKKRTEWKTKDKSVATSNSYVHGKGQGKTTLTRKIGGTTYKCNVYVTDLQKLKKKAINYTDGAKPTAYGYLNGRPVVEMETKYYHIFTGYYSYTYEYIRFTQKFKAICEDSFSTNDDHGVRLEGDKLIIYRDFGDETYITEIDSYKEF